MEMRLEQSALSDSSPASSTRSRIAALEDLKSLLRFAQPEPNNRPPNEGSVDSASTERELSHALALVECTAELIDKSHRRCDEIEEKARRLVKLATEEMKQALDEASSVQKRLDITQAKLDDAEKRLQEATDWNRRFYDSITSAFAVIAPPHSPDF